MNNRDGDRFSVSKEWYQKPEKESMYFLWEGNPSIKARVVDINLYGIGFEIDNVDSGQIDSFRSESELFIELFLGEKSLAASASIVWDSVDGEGGKSSYKGGIRIDIISPDDKLTLFNFIETIRDNGNK